jgi:predicted nucleic acid-binding protein
MSAACFLDTNILLYSISADLAEVPKRGIALDLLDRADIGLSVQVLSEFYVQATRTSRADRIEHDIAAGLVACWLRFPVQDNTAATLRHALDIRAATGFSFWDSAIIAAASALGCHDLMSEDLTHGRVVAGVRIVNPFCD